MIYYFLIYKDIVIDVLCARDCSRRWDAAVNKPKSLSSRASLIETNKSIDLLLPLFFITSALSEQLCLFVCAQHLDSGHSELKV